MFPGSYHTQHSTCFLLPQRELVGSVLGCSAWLELTLSCCHPCPGRGVLGIITRYCCCYFIYYQFIITENHSIWKINIASPVHGISPIPSPPFLHLAFTHMLRINFPSEKVSVLWEPGVIWILVLPTYVFIIRCFLQTSSFLLPATILSG